MLTHKELKARALKRADVKSEYDQLDKEFAFLDEFLKARSSAGITQAEVAERIGTTQSAIARWTWITKKKTGECLPDGERGEMVVTPLVKEAMPLVHYRTGDVTMLMEDGCLYDGGKRSHGCVEEATIC